MSMERLKKAMQVKWRRQRVDSFLRLMRPDRRTRILDVGGTPFFWDVVDVDLNIVMFNRPEEVRMWPPDLSEKYEIIEGDVLDFPFKSQDFDIVFSNSVIEHIPRTKVRQFSRIVRSLAPHYWVQTPSKYFPIEAHCNLPFWWFYPDSVKAWWIARWEQGGRTFLANQMQTTHTYSRAQILELFPHSNVVDERMFGVIKSYTVWK